MHELGSLLTAMVTPFTADIQVDYDRAAELAAKLLAEGNDGLVVAGTTGESPALSDDEKLQLTRVVKEAAGDRIVVMGTGSNNHAHTLHLTSAAAETGCDAVMVVGPYYNKPSPEGYYQHFMAVAQCTELPIIIYNVPGRTGGNITADTTLRLAEGARNFAGIKEASGDLDQVAKICAGKPDHFTVWSGDDGMTLPVMSVGGRGVISVVAHVAGKLMAEMIADFHEGQVRKAAKTHQRLLPLFKAAFLASGNPACIKRALQVCGFDCGGLRLPLVEASEADSQQIAEVCRELGLA